MNCSKMRHFVTFNKLYQSRLSDWRGHRFESKPWYWLCNQSSCLPFCSFLAHRPPIVPFGPNDKTQISQPVFWGPLEYIHFFLKAFPSPKGTLYTSQTHLLPPVLFLRTFARVTSLVFTGISPTVCPWRLSLPFLCPYPPNPLSGTLFLRIWLVLSWSLPLLLF